MKKILISLSIIAAVAAIAIGASVSYFSDTETSSGNTFTAGALDLKIDSTCHYDGMVCTLDTTAPAIWQEETTGSSRFPQLLGEPCSCTWLEKDLVTGDLFFNFLDVKPGDDGENTISLGAQNDAWVCAEILNAQNNDNGCNTPEFAAETAAYGAGKETCGTGTEGIGQGELQNNLYFSIWKDNGAGEHSCNNIKDEDEDYLVQNAQLSDGQWPIADSSTGQGPIPAGQDNCLGVSWNVPPEVGNIIQTDSVSADISFSAVQSRHNPNFLCGPPPEGKGTLTVIKHVINNNGGQATAGNWTMNITGTNPSNNNFAGAESPGVTITLDAGSYSVDESGGPAGYAKSLSAECSGTIAANDTKTCTVTNDDNAPELAQLTIIKHVVNDNGGGATAGNWTMDITGTNPSSNHFAGAESPGVTITLDAGSYSVDESGGPSGYSKSLSADCSGTIAVGVPKTCTITNDDIQPKLHVIKHVENGSGGTKNASNFSITVTGASPSPATFNGAEGGTLVMLNAGSYSVDEAAVSNYTKSLSTDCVGTMLPGDEKTCTITNTFTCFDQADVMLVLDRSGSISSGELTQLKTAALAFVTALAPDGGVHMGQTSFSTTGTLDTQLTGTVGTINTGINALARGGFTNLVQGINLASTELASERDRNDATTPDFMIIITDGNPNRPTPDATARANALAAATAAKGLGTTIYVVGVGSDVSTAYLTSIASPGKYYNISNYAGLQAALVAIATCQQP